jgi:arginase
MVDRVQTKVSEAFKKGMFPLVTGGDCPVLMQCLKAAKSKRGGLGLVFIDGHEDAYPPHKSPTSETADMELGFILGLNSERLSSEIRNDLPLADPSKVCLLGPRDYELTIYLSLTYNWAGRFSCLSHDDSHKA